MITWLILAASGLLTSFCLQYSFLYPLSFFSMAPYFYYLVKGNEAHQKSRKSYGQGLCWSLIYYMGVYSFFLSMYPMEFMGLSKVAAAFVVCFCWIGLSLLQAIGSAFVALIFRLTYRSRVLSPLLFASIWTIFEWIQNFTWLGVPFLRLALSQTFLTASIQSASLFGSLFVSFLVALVNAMFGMGFYYFFQVDRHARQIRVFPLLAIAILLFNFGYGLIKIGLYTEEDDGIVVALIQGNIGSDEKWENEQITNVLELYEDLTRQAVAESGAQIVLFPETAINYSLNLPSRQKERQRLSDLAVQENILLFVGTFDCQSSTDEEEVLTYNAIVAFFPNGEIEEIPYYKRHLVPFGEYVPMETFFRTCMPFLAEMNLFDGTLEAGEDPAILETEFGSFGRLICYDSIYESLSRDSVANGAEILLLSTNDSWYKDSPAVYMHNAHSKLRAVENGRYVLRAANTGVSSIINPLGETEEELGPLLTGYVTGKVHFSSERTLYSYIGDSFIFVCFGVILVESFLKIRQYRQKRETNHDISKGLGR